MPGTRRFISDDVKKIVLRMDSHPDMNRETIHELTGVAPSTQRHIKAIYQRTGQVSVRPLECGRPRILNGLDVGFLEACIERTPDITLKELRRELLEVCDVSVSLSTVDRTLHRRGYARKKLERPALERSEARRMAYQLKIGLQYSAEQLVFVDESHLNRFTTQRAYGWAPVGNRARRRDFFVRGQRYSMLPALSLDGILHLDVFDHSLTKESFNNFIDDLLTVMNPFPAPNSVLIMDNASIHKSQDLRDMVEARGMRLEFLPAYSPDLNPIEEAFSCIKAWIRSNRDYVLGELSGEEHTDPYTMIWEAVCQVTPEKAYGWFKHSGYVV